MVTETFVVILESDLQAAGFTPASNGAFTTVGSSFTYTAAAMPYYQMVVEDNGADQTTLSSDLDNKTNEDGGTNADNEGTDGETGTLYDPNGNPVGTQGGRVASDRAGIMEGSDGSIIEIYEIEHYDDIDMYAFSGPLVEGVTYTVISAEPRDQPIEYAQLICFIAGTRIHTPAGAVPIEDLAVGDLVQTVDHGMQPIRWIGETRVDRLSQRRDPTLRPVVIQKGAIGNSRRLMVTQQHRICLPRHWTGFDEDVLVAAKLLAEEVGGGFSQADINGDLRVLNIMLPRHELIFVEGAVVESFFPGPEALKGCTPADLMSLNRALPNVGAIRSFADAVALYGTPARRIIGRKELRTALPHLLSPAA